MNYDSDVLISFSWYYGIRLILWFGLVSLACVAFIKGRAITDRKHLKTLAVIIGASLLIWCLYFALTAKWLFVELSLDAEDPNTAEYAYFHLFTVDLKSSIRLAADNKQPETVRFYASCRAGELLANTNDKHSLDNVLDQVAEAPMICPLFFGTNAINCEVFTPGTGAGPYSVGSLIQEKYDYSRSKSEVRRNGVWP
jgi:hypothetical protein